MSHHSTTEKIKSDKKKICPDNAKKMADKQNLVMAQINDDQVDFCIKTVKM